MLDAGYWILVGNDLFPPNKGGRGVLKLDARYEILDIKICDETVI
jgi:hypothetical protein